MKTVEKDGKEQPTTKLEEPVTSSNVVEAVAKQRRVELVEQILYMDPIEEIGEGHRYHLKPQICPISAEQYARLSPTMLGAFLATFLQTSLPQRMMLCFSQLVQQALQQRSGCSI